MNPKEIPARKALNDLTQFIGPSQRRCVLDGFRCEEAEFFFDKILELHALIAAMPKTYEQDGKGDQAIVTLHYFAGGQANWYITEKDKGVAADPANGVVEDRSQTQAFGLADLFGDGGELGYISIEEILSVGGELDFHFRPRTLREVRTRCAA